MSTLDIVLIAIALISVIIGLSKGVLRQLFSIGSIVLAILAAYFLINPVFNFAHDESIGTLQPYEAIYEKVNDLAVEKLGEGINAPITQETVAEQITGALENMGLPGLLASPITSALSEQITVVEGKSLGDLFVPLVSSFLLKVICYVLIFVVAFILLKIVFAILSKFLNRGFLKGIDRLVGAVIGFAVALIIINVVMYALTFVGGVAPSVSEFVVNDVNSSMGIASYFYDKNWIGQLMANGFDFNALLDGIINDIPR